MNNTIGVATLTDVNIATTVQSLWITSLAQFIRMHKHKLRNPAAKNRYKFSRQSIIITVRLFNAHLM